MATILLSSETFMGTRAQGERDMSRFSDGQLRQAGNALAEAGWSAEDLTLLGQAGRDRLIGIRDSLRRGGDMIIAITEGRTELWLAPEQDTRWVGGRKILSHLTQTGLLASCADLDELKAIQAKGIEFFQQYFAAGKAIFGWRDVQDNCVPYLIELDGEVVLLWVHLNFGWDAIGPALRHK